MNDKIYKEAFDAFLERTDGEQFSSNLVASLAMLKDELRANTLPKTFVREKLRQMKINPRDGSMPTTAGTGYNAAIRDLSQALLESDEKV